MSSKQAAGRERRLFLINVEADYVRVSLSLACPPPDPGCVIRPNPVSPNPVRGHDSCEWWTCWYGMPLGGR